MRTSCIQHPANEPLVILRKWQVEACEGNHCAAALLSFFEYWHNIKMEMSGQVYHEQAVAENHGADPPPAPTLLQWHSQQCLIDGLLSLYGKAKINQSIKLLESLGFLSVHRNPNPSYAFDKTRHFKFYPSAVNDWLFSYNAVAVSGQRLDRSSQRLTESDRTSPESSSEITSEKRKDTERAREEFIDQGQKGQEDADLASLRQAALDTLDEAETRRDEYVRRGEEEKLCPACNEPEGLGHVAGCEYGIATKGEATDAQRGLQRLAGIRPVHAPADRASLLHDAVPEIIPADRPPARGLVPAESVRPDYRWQRGAPPELTDRERDALADAAAIRDPAFHEEPPDPVVPDALTDTRCQSPDPNKWPCPHEASALAVLAGVFGEAQPRKYSHHSLHTFVHSHSLQEVMAVAQRYVDTTPDRTEWELYYIFAPNKAETLLAAIQHPPPAAPKAPSRPEDTPVRHAAYKDFAPADPEWAQRVEAPRTPAGDNPVSPGSEPPYDREALNATFNMNQATQDAERHTPAQIAAYLREQKEEEK